MTKFVNTGTHPHLFDNVLDIQPGEDAAEGDVLTLDGDLKPQWEPPTSGPHDIISATHSDTDTGDTPADGDVLTFDTADSKWHPVAPAASLPSGGTTGQALAKDSGTDGDASWHNVEDLATAETDDTKVLAADGAGGLQFVSVSGVGAVSKVRTYISFGSNMSGQAYSP